MKKTEYLGLPIYDSPETDLFKLNDWNEANASLDASHKDLTMFRDELPKVNANAEVIDARGGEATLGDKVRGINSQLAEKVNKNDLQQISLSYKESYSTLALLKSEYPTGDIYNHSVLEDGFIYTYKTDWISTGIQSNGTGIPQIDITKLNQYKIISENIYDFTKNVVGYLKIADGTVVSDSNFYTSEFIEVTPSTKYIIKKLWYVAYYGSDKSLISCQKPSQTSQLVITTYYNCKYIRFSNYKVDLSEELNQVNLGEMLYTFDNYKKAISKDYLEVVDNTADINSLNARIDKIDNVLMEINIPSIMYGIVGKEINIYFQNIIDGKLEDYYIDVWNVNSRGKQLEYKWTFTPSIVEDIVLFIKVFDKRYNLIMQKSITIKVKAVTTGSGNKKVLVIGDSTIKQGYNTQKLLDLFALDNSMKIELIGTQGTSPNFHEGQDGKAIKHLRLSPNNPFFNPASGDFDFSYYIQNNNTQKIPDFVIINLGINDVFGIEDEVDLLYQINSLILPNFNFVVNNIKTYNSNIKILINIPIPPNESQDIFGNAYGSNQTRWRYKRNNVLMQKALITNFIDKENTNIYLCPVHFAIDCKNNILDGVHPTVNGAVQIGDVEYYTIKSLS